MNKLTKEQYKKLYSKDTSVGEFRTLRELAQERMDYVRNFIQEHWIDANGMAELDYDNAQSIALEHHFRQLEDGFFDPERYTTHVTFMDGYCTEEEFYPHEFSLISIEKYKIIVNTIILYKDFEQEILDWIEKNGEVWKLQDLAEQKLAAAYQSDYRKIIDLLGPELSRYVRIVDRGSWKIMKENPNVRTG